MTAFLPSGSFCALLLASCFLLLTPPIYPAPADFEGKRIVTIQFDPPDQPVDLEEIHRILPLRANTPLRLDDVAAAIDRLYATGHYADIQVEAEPYNDGVIIRFLTRNSWFIGRVAVEGRIKEPPNNGQLVNATRLNLGEPFNEQRLGGAVQGVQQTLEVNGFYESRLEPRTDYDARFQQVHIRFDAAADHRAQFTTPEVTGDPKLPPADIVSATRWKGWFGWRGVTQSRVQRGVERVRSKYQKQNRLMAAVSIEDLAYDSKTRSVKPTLNVTAGPTVEIRTVGAKVSRSRLKRYIPVYEESTVDHDLLMEGRRNLRDYFQSQGFFEAQIEFKQQRVVNDKAVIDYLINTGPRHSLVRIGIEGNRYFDTDTIRERMFMLPRSLQFRHGRYSESLRERDQETISNLYRENGFRDVKVTSTAEDNYNGKQHNLAAVIHIAEGPQWFVAKLDVTGIEQLEHERILDLLSSTEGQPFSEFNVAVDRDAILGRYFAEGFSEATFEWTYKPTDRPHQVELLYTIKEGQRRFVRQVITSGLGTTNAGLVNRNLLLNPGDPLSQIRMVETQKRLYDLGIFARVNVAIQNPEGETQKKYVLYQMEEARRYSITGGFGAEIGRIGGGRDFQAPGGKTGFSPRVSFDASRLNFRGLGHTISFRSRVSNLQSRALINYSAPRVRDIPDLNLSFTVLYDDSRDVRTFNAIRREGSVQLSQRLSKANTALYRFSYRSVTVGSLQINEVLLPVLSQPVRIGMAAGSLIQDRRDDPTDSHRGIFNTFDFGLAYRGFGSEADFTRFLGRNSTYHPYGKKLVVARSVSVGWIQPIRFQLIGAGTRATDVPLPERFFSGGGSTHRGFPANQAGPRDEQTGFPLGGRALLMHNSELRFPLIGDNISGVLFHDAGNVYSRIGNVSFRWRQRDLADFDYMVHAVGLGVRYRTPIGPLRLDLAWVPNSPRFQGCKGSTAQELSACTQKEEQRISRFQFHFSIGQAF